MASHGVPRAAVREVRDAEARKKELKEIQEYQQLVDQVNTKVNPKIYASIDMVLTSSLPKVSLKEYTPELLQKTTALLRKNPEYYTIWNHRRRIYAHEFEHLTRSAAAGEIKEEDRISQILDIIQLDLQFLFPLLVQFPKCYWIWNHRLWLLEQSSILLPPHQARKLWEEELGLVGKMLSRDSRNFHGWGYRRMVVQNLERPALKGHSMARTELEYTTKMIKANLSNFSAWHNRTKLILRMLAEDEASDDERQKMLEEEFKLIHNALFDPYDQSLWFYHQNLMCTFDPDVSAKTMAPNLTREQRLAYIASEQDFIEEVLEDARDCKWAYQALIESALIEAKLTSGGLQGPAKAKILGWLAMLKTLDPLRNGRWVDLERTLAAE